MSSFSKKIIFRKGFQSEDHNGLRQGQAAARANARRGSAPGAGEYPPKLKEIQYV